MDALDTFRLPCGLDSKRRIEIIDVNVRLLLLGSRGRGKRGKKFTSVYLDEKSKEERFGRKVGVSGRTSTF